MDDKFFIEFLRRKRLHQILDYLNNNLSSINVSGVYLTPKFSSFNCSNCKNHYANNIVYKNRDDTILKCLDCLLGSGSSNDQYYNKQIIYNIPKNIGENFFTAEKYNKFNCNLCKKEKQEFFGTGKAISLEGNEMRLSTLCFTCYVYPIKPIDDGGSAKIKENVKPPKIIDGAPPVFNGGNKAHGVPDVLLNVDIRYGLEPSSNNE